jgi:hypothetical protein
MIMITQKLLLYIIREISGIELKCLLV